MQLTAVIPARLASSRFPQKILKELGGIPVLRWILQRVTRSGVFDEVFALVDDSSVLELVHQWGFEAKLTSPDCNSGTDRAVSAIKELSGDFIINVQGDEPFVEIQLLKNLSKRLRSDAGDIELLTAVYPIKNSELLHNPNRVKVVRDCQGRALYFSRSCIPYVRENPSRGWTTDKDWTQCCDFWGHIGIYAYRRSLLERYHSLKTGFLDQVEQLEQLRFLENGVPIHCIEAHGPTLSIDVPNDLVEAERFLQQHPELRTESTFVE